MLPNDPTGPTRAAVAAAIGRLDLAAIVDARWFGAKGRSIASADLDEAFVLDAGAGHVLAIVDVVLDDRSRQRYSIALTGKPAVPAEPGAGAWRALAVAMGEGRTIPALPRDPEGGLPPTAALVCRPAPALADLAWGRPAEIAGATERDPGADQSNTSVILGDSLLLKAYRRLQPGLNPDLEMTAFLSEEARFPAIPRLAGFAEVVSVRDGTTTVAMLQEYIADGADAFESIAESLTAWLLAPGEVSLEFATDIAADLGTLTAGLHAALAGGHGLPEMAPREATGEEVRSWAKAAHDHLETALEVTPGEAGEVVRDLAPRIAEALTVLDALPTAPEVIRAHGDYHLGQVLIAPDGFRIIDFEGEPLGSPEQRRAHRPTLRDVASMLRSLDHVARSASRRAEQRHGGPLQHVGFDLHSWLRRSRERFLEAYQAGLREQRVWIDLDPDLLRAFEIDKELYEFAYAATYLPSWLYAPTEGMRALFEDAR
jgi:trehalose synthase-fused probable maltokinase